MVHAPTAHDTGTAVLDRPSSATPALPSDASPAPVPDLLVRDTFQDTGAVPTSGWISISPDIIPYGDRTLDVNEAIGHFRGPDIGKTIAVPGTNNVYVRALNQYDGASETGNAALYCCPASLLMLPDQWDQRQLKTRSGGSTARFVNQSGAPELRKGQIGLTEEPFALDELAAPEPGDHYCLVAVVNTPHTTVNIPRSFDQNVSFVSWVQNTPAVAWRNVNLVSTTAERIVANMIFGNVNSQGETFHFTLRGRNLPVGTTVTVTCGASDCRIDETLTMPAPQPNGRQSTGFDQYVPGGGLYVATVTATPPAGKGFPAGASLSTQYYQYPQAEMSDLERQVGRFVTVARTLRGGRSAHMTQLMIPMGECTFDVVDSD